MGRHRRRLQLATARALSESGTLTEARPRILQSICEVVNWDLGAVWANPVKAEKLLGWKAELGLERMCEDSWRWVSQNPNGYTSG